MKTKTRWLKKMKQKRYNWKNETITGGLKKWNNNDNNWQNEIIMTTIDKMK
jgi:hypothetical protein